MLEVSEKKKKFLESIGIDIKDLPPEFQRHSDAMEETLSKEEIEFLNRESLTGRYKKEFCLKDLVGTTHPDYSDKSWLEAFLLSKRGDSIVEQYFKNPEYYSKGLKQFDQSDTRHETPLELYESDGKFFINGGNNRLSLIMMKYLAEISKAQTDEERAKIDKDYTFVAEVQPTPKDKDIMYMLNMLRENSGKDTYIKRIARNEEDCEYTIQTKDRTIRINNKEELTQALKDTYQLNKVKSLDELKDNIAHLLQDGYVYKVRQDENRTRILEGMFPDLEKFEANLDKLKKYRIEDRLYEGIDLQNIDFSELSNRAMEIVVEKEKTIEEEQKEEEPKEKNIGKSEKVKEDIAKELKKEYIGQQITSIPDSIETTYYELKQEEIKFCGLARKLGLNYSVTRTDDINIYSNITQIKSNMQRISEQLQNIDDITSLDKVSSVLQELDGLTQDGTITSEHNQMLKDTFEKSFNLKVQNLIRSSKLSILEQEKEQVENEKISVIGKILGKGRLKQARIDNIKLKKQLLMTENLQEKETFSLEDSLSDLYAYSQCELGRKLTPEMQEFLGVIKATPQLSQMIDQQNLKIQFEQKVNNRKDVGKLVPIDKNRRVSNRNQVDILQVQNNEMSRQIQKNRARTVTRQNNLSSTSIKNNSALSRFQDIVNEINLSTQIRQNQKEEQENNRS